MSFGGEGDWNWILVVVNDGGRGGVERTHGGCGGGGCGAEGVGGGGTSWTMADDASLANVLHRPLRVPSVPEAA